MDDEWGAFLKAQSAASWVLTHPQTPKDPMVMSSGLTNLHRIAQLAWELAFEYRDYNSPKLFPVSVRNLSHGWNSSNAVYYVGVIDGTRNYRLRGSRGHAPFVEVGIYDNLDGLACLAAQAGGAFLQSKKRNSRWAPVMKSP